MPRSFGVVFVVALMMWALMGVLAGRALGNHVQCGDVVKQDTSSNFEWRAGRDATRLIWQPRPSGGCKAETHSAAVQRRPQYRGGAVFGPTP
jgi:hypothetical protein